MPTEENSQQTQEQPDAQDQAFLEEIQEESERHDRQLVPIMQFTPQGIEPKFSIEKLSELKNNEQAQPTPDQTNEGDEG